MLSNGWLCSGRRGTLARGLASILILLCTFGSARGEVRHGTRCGERQSFSISARRPWNAPDSIQISIVSAGDGERVVQLSIAGVDGEVMRGRVDGVGRAWAGLRVAADVMGDSAILVVGVGREECYSEYRYRVDRPEGRVACLLRRVGVVGVERGIRRRVTQTVEGIVWGDTLRPVGK